MPHLEVRFAPCDEALAKAVGDALEEIWTVDVQATAVLETSPGAWQVTGYVESTDTDVAASIRAALGARIVDLPGFDVVAVDDRDWVAEGLKNLDPIAAERFTVHGSHNRGAASPGSYAIEIDAGQAFGTGHHATTLGCLEVLSDMIRRGYGAEKTLDLGTGSGVLAIAAAKAFKSSVIATDIDPVAVAVARHNARLNGVAPLIRCARAAGTRSAIVRGSAPFELVFANILAKPLIRLAPDIAAVAAAGSYLVLSGLLDTQAPPIRAAFTAAGYHLVSRFRHDGWTTLALRFRPTGGERQS